MIVRPVTVISAPVTVITDALPLSRQLSRCPPHHRESRSGRSSIRISEVNTGRQGEGYRHPPPGLSVLSAMAPDLFGTSNDLAAQTGEARLTNKTKSQLMHFTTLG